MKSINILLMGLLFLCLSGCKEETTENAMSRQMMMSTNVLPAQNGYAENTVMGGPTDVYICKSPGASRYHYNENCSGLKRCKHTIEKTTIKKAEATGLTMCKLED
jgi:hypothetical protein